MTAAIHPTIKANKVIFTEVVIKQKRSYTLYGFVFPNNLTLVLDPIEGDYLYSAPEAVDKEQPGVVSVFEVLDDYVDFFLKDLKKIAIFNINTFGDLSDKVVSQLTELGINLDS